jgi:hypothetical protein
MSNHKTYVFVFSKHFIKNLKNVDVIILMHLIFTIIWSYGSNFMHFGIILLILYIDFYTIL